MTGRTHRVSEKVVQQQVVNLLRSVGGKVFVLGTRRRKGDYMGTMMAAGLPDLCAFIPLRRDEPARGWRFVWIEVKAEGGRLRAEQAEFRSYCEVANTVHLVGGVSEVADYLIQVGLIREVAHYRTAAV